VASDHAPHEDYVKRCELSPPPTGSSACRRPSPDPRPAGGREGFPFPCGRPALRRPARLLSLKGKGTLAPGADADVTVVDPTRSGSSARRTSSPNRGTARSSGGSCGAVRRSRSAAAGSAIPASPGSIPMAERKAVLACRRHRVRRDVLRVRRGERRRGRLQHQHDGVPGGLTDPSTRGRSSR